MSDDQPTRNAPRRRRWQMIAVPLLGLAVLLGGLWWGQRRLIYFPGNRVPIVETVLPGWSEVELTTEDGLQLGAWHLPPAAGAPVVIVFNGNAGNRADRADLGRALADRGWGVLLVDYRGYGGNPGSPSEDGLALDARAAWNFVEREAGHHPIIIFGESLGAAVAVGLAAERAPAALILRSPWTSLPDTAAVHYPFLPVRAILHDEFPSLDRIGSVAAPVLIVAGTDDTIIPAAQSRRLFEAASEPKRLVMVAGADHNDFGLSVGAELLGPVTAFVTEHVTG